MRKAARRIVEKLRLHGQEAFFAGGWVRDFLLRRKPKDIDIATSALPDEVIRLFPNSRAIGAQFGVVQVVLYGRAYEVTTFRSDSDYTDGRHPSAVTFSGPEQDAVRRDFTINGLFYDPIGNRLIDYVHGRADIQNRLIRTIGNPCARFTEDKLRMLRAVRFSCDLGFAIVPETWEAIKQLAPEIVQISHERIRDELTRLFTGPAPDRALDLLYTSGLMQHILPEIAALRGVAQSVEAHPGMDVFEHTRNALARLRKPSLCLAFATLLHDVGKAHVYSAEEPACFSQHARAGGKISEEIGRRLRMSNEEIGQIVDLVTAHEDFIRIGELRESARRRLLLKRNIADHLELLRVNSLSNRKSLETYSKCMESLEKNGRESTPLIRGEDLLQMGFPAGPLIGTILRDVEDLQFEGELKTREEALRHVKASYRPESEPLPKSED